jgi:hypothetical protein
MTRTTSLRVAFQIAALLGAVCLTHSAIADRTTASVYRCNLKGVTTFSDRPCDAEARLQEVDTATMNVLEPQSAAPIPTSRPKRASARRPEVGQRANTAKHQENCARLVQSLKEVRSKMRSGYKAHEGEQLRIREEKLKNQLRLAKCR